jgi:hypothetical protein
MRNPFFKFERKDMTDTEKTITTNCLPALTAIFNQASLVATAATDPN